MVDGECLRSNSNDNRATWEEYTHNTIAKLPKKWTKRQTTITNGDQDSMYNEVNPIKNRKRRG